jgi:hypothetical protein
MHVTQWNHRKHTVRENAFAVTPQRGHRMLSAIIPHPTFADFSMILIPPMMNVHLVDTPQSQDGTPYIPYTFSSQQIAMKPNKIDRKNDQLSTLDGKRKLPNSLTTLQQL